METTQNTDNLPVIINVPITLSDRKTTKKLTKAKQKAILEEYQRTGNLSKSCWLNGVSRQNFYAEMQRNQQLSETFDLIKQCFADSIEETSMTVALQPSREGFNDRKLMLQAIRPEIYGNKQEITANVRVEAVVATADLRNLLSSYKLSE